MPETIEAMFENVVFRPLQPVSLAERTIVKISIRGRAPLMVDGPVDAIEFIRRLLPGSRTRTDIDAQIRA